MCVYVVDKSVSKFVIIWLKLWAEMLYRLIKHKFQEPDQDHKVQDQGPDHNYMNQDQDRIWSVNVRHENTD